MILTKLLNYKQYQNHQDLNHEINLKYKEIEQNLQTEIIEKGNINVNGFSWTAQAECTFLLDSLYSNDNDINFRERLVCNITKLNNRLRGSIHVFEEVLKPTLSDKIYLTEQCSLLAGWMNKKYKQLYGSEYVNDCSWYYKLRLKLRLFPNRLHHQDLTNLNIENKSFNYVLSFDCLEHIPNFKKALEEIYRVLNTDGEFLLSVPFDINCKNNLVRAKVDNNGKIQHLVEPEYHGDPVSGHGCLSYYTFGWQLLDDLKKIGFKETNLILYRSEKYCYLGGEQIIIYAKK